MTSNVTDAKLREFALREFDWLKRVEEGSLDPDEVIRAVQQIIDRLLNKKRIRVDILKAYFDDMDVVRKNVLAYVDMIIGMEVDNTLKLSSHPFPIEPLWTDPTNGRIASINRVDRKYIDSVESKLGLCSAEHKEGFRCKIRQIYSQERNTNPNYDFMDNSRLVEGVVMEIFCSR